VSERERHSAFFNTSSPYVHLASPDGLTSSSSPGHSADVAPPPRAPTGLPFPHGLQIVPYRPSNSSALSASRVKDPQEGETGAFVGILQWVFPP